jgi:hypothetical protein
MDDLVIYKNNGEVFGAGFKLKDMGLKGLASIEGDSEVNRLLADLYVPAGLFTSPIKRDKSDYFKGKLYDNILSLCPKTKKRRTTTNRRTKKWR